jgi:hypothetical protein
MGEEKLKTMNINVFKEFCYRGKQSNEAIDRMYIELRFKNIILIKETACCMVREMVQKKGKKW